MREVFCCLSTRSRIRTVSHRSFVLFIPQSGNHLIALFVSQYAPRMGFEPMISCSLSCSLTTLVFGLSTYKAGALPLGHHGESLLANARGSLPRLAGELNHWDVTGGWFVELKGHSVVDEIGEELASTGNSIIVLRIKLCDDETIGQIHPYRRRRQTGQSTV